ncbi:hypothetical protein FDECE_14060 [Fusarium decemcellulare]|nr:hypothetical protein FDECE_14060 [Fusarium decemcellulare]
MQPFARPVARLVWGHARLGLDRATRPGRTCWGGYMAQRPLICAQCSIRAIGPPGRLYSTRQPSKDPEKSRTDKDVEAELESILKPRPSRSKALQPVDGPNLEDTRLGDAKLESTPAQDTKPDSPKAEDINAESTMPNDAAESQETPSKAESFRDRAKSRVSNLKERFSRAMDTLQARAMNASQTLNDITGYTGIEAIKHQNSQLEAQLAEAHERVRNARQTYKTSNTSRAATQREVTTLLARKDSWSPGDLERFTELYRADHVLEGKVASSQEALIEAETEEQSLSQQLNAGNLKRYHEEQIWSDRIRRASTWGTWGLMGMNFLLFVILQFVAEPWKRRRLVKGVVAEEKVVLEEVRSQLEQVKLAIERRDQPAAVAALTEAVEAAGAEAQVALETVTSEEGLPAEEILSLRKTPSQAPASALPEPTAEAPPLPQKKWEEVLLDPTWWRTKAQDLYSERRIDLRMRDASLLVLEGALAGAALTGSIALLIARR